MHSAAWHHAPMDEVTVNRSELTDEQAEAFRRAAGERGIDSVVEWQGRPHVVSRIEDTPQGERFTLEPVPRPFG